jgi:DNA-binding NarL/FixJ family response regulator
MNGGPHVIVLDVQRLRGEALAAALHGRGVSAATSPAAEVPTIAVVHGDAVHQLAAVDREGSLPVVLLVGRDGHDSRVERRAAVVLRSADDFGAVERAVRDVLAGRSRTAPAASPVVDSPAAHARQAVRRLSGREQAVLERVAQGRRNDEIGTDLGISQHTVRTHVQNIFGKLDVSNRHAAVAIARRGGMRLDTGADA